MKWIPTMRVFWWLYVGTIFGAVSSGVALYIAAMQMSCVPK